MPTLLKKIWTMGPDEKYLLYSEPWLFLFDIESQAYIEPPIRNNHFIVDVAWHRDSQLFATAHLDEVRIWDVNTQEPTAILARPYFTNLVDHIKWSSDGQYWGYTTTRVLGAFAEVRSTMLTVVNMNDDSFAFYAPNYSEWDVLDNRLIVANMSGMQIWELQTQELLRQEYFQFEYINIGNKIVDINSEKIVVVDDTIRLFDSFTGDITNHFYFSNAQAVHLRPQSDMLLIDTPTMLHLVDIDNQAILFELAHERIRNSPQIWWHPSGDYVAVLFRTLTIWHVSEDGTEWTQLQNLSVNDPLTNLTWHPTEPQIALVSGHSLRIYNVITSSIHQQIELPLQGGVRGVTSLAWSPDGSQIAMSFDREPALFMLSLVQPKH